MENAKYITIGSNYVIAQYCYTRLAAIGSDAVAGNQTELATVLQEDISGGLSWVDSDSIVGDDGRRRRWHLELFGGKLEDGGERSSLWDRKPERKAIKTHFFRISDAYTLNGSFGSLVRVILKVTLLPAAAVAPSDITGMEKMGDLTRNYGKIIRERRKQAEKNFSNNLESEKMIKFCKEIEKRVKFRGTETENCQVSLMKLGHRVVSRPAVSPKNSTSLNLSWV